MLAIHFHRGHTKDALRYGGIGVGFELGFDGGSIGRARRLEILRQGGDAMGVKCDGLSIGFFGALTGAAAKQTSLFSAPPGPRKLSFDPVAAVQALSASDPLLADLLSDRLATGQKPTGAESSR